MDYTFWIISQKIEINETQIQIINIYAPNNSTERRQFINNISNIIDTNRINMIAGDLNLVLNSELDREPPRHPNDSGYKELINLILKMFLEYKTPINDRLAFLVVNLNPE